MAMKMTVESPNADHRAALTADAALQIAWATWFCMLVIPFILFLGVGWYLTQENVVANTALAQKWFIGCMAYMILGVPAAFFYRSRIFQGYWHGHGVSPRSYVLGMSAIWLSLEVGGLLALTGCLISGTLLPNLLPALVAFMLFTPLWPNGHSMTRPLQNERDPGSYEDPR